MMQHIGQRRWVQVAECASLVREFQCTYISFNDAYLSIYPSIHTSIHPSIYLYYRYIYIYCNYIYILYIYYSVIYAQHIITIYNYNVYFLASKLLSLTQAAPSVEAVPKAPPQKAVAWELGTAQVTTCQQRANQHNENAKKRPGTARYIKILQLVQQHTTWLIQTTVLP